MQPNLKLRSRLKIAINEQIKTFIYSECKKIFTTCRKDRDK